MRNWRTTILGYLQGLPIIAFDLADAYSRGTFDGKHGLGLFVAAMLILKGHFTKDANVSGKGM